MQDYKFFPHLDSVGHDIMYVGKKPITELIKISNRLENCIGFNTLGFMKCIIRDESEFKAVDVYAPDDGLYVNLSRYYKNKKTQEVVIPKTTIVSKSGKQKFRIKMLCNWCDSKSLCDEWNNMSMGNYCWNDLEITWTNTDIDFYVIINMPYPGERYIPERTIVFQMEPRCDNVNQNWGTKTWGEWANPDESKFLQVRTHNTHYNNGFWQLKTTYSEFKNAPIIKQPNKIISSICSSKYFDPGHIKRIDFLKYLERQNDDIVKVDIYNHDNQHNFANYLGPHPPGNKDVGILPYKYYFMAENNQEKNFITEKIWEPLLAESLCFYWGCPNIDDYIDPCAFIKLDLDDMPGSYAIMKQAIMNNEWEKRIEIIRREKQKVLEYYGFFPTLQRIIKHDFCFNYAPSDAEIVYRKFFSKTTRLELKKVCFIHSCAINNNIAILQGLISKLDNSGLLKQLDHVFVVNLGDAIPNSITNSKISIINYSKNTQLFEKPTINLIQLFSQFNNAKILYLHTKGVSYQIVHPNIIDWSNFMTHCLINHHATCLDLLDVYDTVGCNYFDTPKRHFSGNFWWSNTSYIKTLPPITSNVRHDAEWWILSGDANYHCLAHSKVDHYQQPYPMSLYQNIHFDHLTNYPIIKVINLARRPDRKKHIIQQLKQAGITNYDIVPAIDGKTLVPTAEIIAMFKGNDFGTRKSFIGCALSHYTLWKALVASTDNEYLIMEDDVIIDTHINHKIKYLMDSCGKFDILYLGHSVRRANVVEYQKITSRTVMACKLRVPLSIGGFFGYIITKQGANKLLDYINQNGIKHGIDYLPLAYATQLGLIQYEVIPQLIRTEYVDDAHHVDSDIQYDYDKLF